jgi:hypothetical protein
MLIVTVTRCDLRDEFAMAAADEIFALSPITARAALPSEADYDAIREAFMETARGRWFLGEYGKRNRNADTSMVLDAVARIEATIATQNQKEEKEDPADKLSDMLVLIRGMVSDAKTSATKTVTGPDAEAALAVVNKAIRIIREISWTLREYGTDSRICDMLDTQLHAIDANHQETIAADKRDALIATFDLLLRRVGEFGGSNDTWLPPDTEAAAPSSAPAAREAAVAPAANAERMPSAFDRVPEIHPLNKVAVTEAAIPVSPDRIDIAAPVGSTFPNKAFGGEPTRHASAQHGAEHANRPAKAGFAAATDSAAETAANHSPDQPATAPAVSETAELDFEMAQDMAVLDAIALQMAEPDVAELDVAEPNFSGLNVLERKSPEAQAAHPDPVRLSLVEPDTAQTRVVEADAPDNRRFVDQLSEPVVLEQVPEIAIAPAQQPEPKTPAQTSLGASLIASGIVSGRGPTHEAMAPIRRMTQAERIAFFS